MNREPPTASAPVAGKTLRVARPTDDIAAVRAFYVDGMGFDVLGEFHDHAGFDGLIMGHAGVPYHLEVTHQRGHEVGKAPSQDHLLIFYVPDRGEWDRAVRRMRDAGFMPVPSCNPYWDRVGVTFEDPDGYRVVLQNAPWPPR